MARIRHIYLFLLGICIGSELALGIFVAPVIFFPSNFIGENILTHFQSGQLMTQIFIKGNYLLLYSSVFFFIYELINFFLAKAENFKIKFSGLMLSLVILGLACLFVFYFTDYIVQAQILGAEATQSADFASIHSASELVMKIIVIAQALLFFVRAKKN